MKAKQNFLSLFVNAANLDTTRYADTFSKENPVHYDKTEKLLCLQMKKNAMKSQLKPSI